MELPAYHLPNMLTVTHYAFGKAWSFVKRAGTIIFALTILIWFLSTYNGHLQVVETDHSLLADFGRLFAWLFKPLDLAIGKQPWQLLLVYWPKKP